MQEKIDFCIASRYKKFFNTIDFCVMMKFR